jgi:succinate dehydrogenase / fumarate reductase, membrane anchor subunit
MAILTDRKRAEGMGSAKSGTEHHWRMMVTSCLLLVLVPFFVFTFGRALGLPHDQAVAYYARPWPALVAALTFVVAMVHFRGGVQVLIEDYVHGEARKLAVIAMIGLAYLIAAIGLFAIARLAL